LAAVVLSGAARAGDGIFRLDTLPRGKSVTIPRPATTYVPLAERARFTATDTPQTLSLKPVNTGRGPAQPLRVAIYDATQERVQQVEVVPGTTFLYTFKGLSSIMLIPRAKAPAGAGMQLKVESNKPLEIAH